MAQKKLIDDETVLEKALQVISEKGTHNFTLKDVGKAVGLAPATLLQRFGSKHQLLILAAKQAQAKLKHDLEVRKNKRLHWDKELIQFLVRIPEGFGRQDIANSLSSFRLNIIDPELHQIVRQLLDCLREYTYELLLQGQACKQLDLSLNIKTIVWELDALGHGLAIQWTFSGRGSLRKWMQKGFQEYLSRIKK